MRVLFICTANICRSPMAAGLFMKAAQQHDASGAIAASAGFLEGGRPVHEYATELLEERGVDVSRKRSQKLSAQVVDHADLILTMTSEHARGVVSRFPHSISNVYTMRHFGTIVSPRSEGQSTHEWLDEIHQANRRSYLGDNEALDIPDPIGQSMKVFIELGIELENTLDWIMGCAYSASVAAS